MTLPSFKNNYDIAVEKLIPHRSPFLFVDKLISADETGAIGEYTFEKNDFFKGHFPSNSIVPGVILIEAMSQVACCGASARLNSTNIKFYLIGVKDARFHEKFIPGDKLTTIVRVNKEHFPFCEYHLIGFKNQYKTEISETPSVEATVKCIIGDVDL